MSGQSIVDRLNAAKHTVSGSALGRAVVKATTEEVMAPKRKHLDYLLQATSEINVSIPQMADLLIERTQNASWVVTFKSLITIHNLMCYGNERFSQYMASHNSKFLLNNFLDKSGVQGVDMSSYIRKYAAYLNEKRETYKLMGFDFCKVKRGKDDGMLRTMQTEKLLKTLPILHQQLDALLHFDIQPNELTNSVINSCFVLLSKDLIRLFACYNDGVINLLEKYFDMNKKNCKEALEMYKKFLDSTDKVSAFLKVAESAGMDKSDIPDLTKAPGSLLEALESHLLSLENKKPGAVSSTTPTSSSTATATNATSYKPPSSVTNAINSLSSNASLSAEEKRKVIEEEAKTLESFKSMANPNEVNHARKQSSLQSPTNGNNGHNVEDLFNMDFKSPQLPQSQQPQHHQQQQSNRPSDDLLMLSNTTTPASSNPFGVQGSVAFNGTTLPFMQQQQQQQQQQSAPLDNLFSGLTFSSHASTAIMSNTRLQPQPSSSSLFTDQATSVHATAVAPTTTTTTTTNTTANTITTNATKTTATSSYAALSDFDAFGDVLQPMNANGASMKPQTPTNEFGVKTSGNDGKKILSTDIDSSLASLADNLDINYKNKGLTKNHQWTQDQQQGQLKTGGNDWKPMKTTSNSFTTSIITPVTSTMPMQAAPMWNPIMSNGAMPPVSMMQMPVTMQAQQANWNNPFLTSAPAAAVPMYNMPVQAQLQQSRPLQPTTTTSSTNPFGF